VVSSSSTYDYNVKVNNKYVIYLPKWGSLSSVLDIRRPIPWSVSVHVHWIIGNSTLNIILELPDWNQHVSKITNYFSLLFFTAGGKYYVDCSTECCSKMWHFLPFLIGCNNTSWNTYSNSNRIIMRPTEFRLFSSTFVTCTLLFQCSFVPCFRLSFKYKMCSFQMFVLWWSLYGFRYLPWNATVLWHIILQQPAWNSSQFMGCAYTQFERSHIGVLTRRRPVAVTGLNVLYKIFATNMSHCVVIFSDALVSNS
jgi:hypothetical protein